jgi:hypothetical protein
MSAADAIRGLSGRPDIAADLERKYEEDAKHEAMREKFDRWFDAQMVDSLRVFGDGYHATLTGYETPIGVGFSRKLAIEDLRRQAYEQEMDK